MIARPRIGAAARAAGRLGRRPWLWIIGAGVALLGHIWFWYLPRVRQDVPHPGDAPAALLADERFAVRLWLPYPHQNLMHLGHLVDNVGGPRAYMESLARLAGTSEPWLPGFGPFTVPPARELTVAVGGDGNVAVAARMYPIMSVIGRLAGLVGNNPWLAGGEVLAAGRAARVRWRGSLWLLESGAVDARSLSSSPDRPGRLPPPGVAAIAVTRAKAPLGAGTYVVARTSSGGLLCRLIGGSAAPEPILPGLVDAEMALVLLERAKAGDLAPGTVRALLLSRPTTEGPGELPGAAAVASVGSRRFSLPGERLSSLLDLRLSERQIDGLVVVALDRNSLDAASRLATALAREDGAEASFELWGNPVAIADLAAHLARALEQVPFLTRREARFWRDVERVLSPLRRFGTAVLVSSGGAVEVRLEPSGQLTDPR